MYIWNSCFYIKSFMLFKSYPRVCHCSSLVYCCLFSLLSICSFGQICVDARINWTIENCKQRLYGRSKDWNWHFIIEIITEQFQKRKLKIVNENKIHLEISQAVGSILRIKIHQKSWKHIRGNWLSLFNLYRKKIHHWSLMISR